jgi:hypothetical protein
VSNETIQECVLKVCAVAPSGSGWADWVPLFQTGLWVGLLGIGAYWFKDQITALVGALEHRIRSGSAFKAGPIEFGEDLKKLERVLPAPTPAPSSTDDWSKERDGIYQANEGLFLVHAIRPSKDPKQKYDIAILVVGHKSRTLEDIEYAEFFFGTYWQNKVFKEMPRGGLVGITTSAYGPFLCTCHVTLKNKKVIRLHRYVDFEMGRVFERKG